MMEMGDGIGYLAANQTCDGWIRREDKATSCVNDADKSSDAGRWGWGGRGMSAAGNDSIINAHQGGNAEGGHGCEEYWGM